jgi:plasmid stabilization system protein ParE
MGELKVTILDKAAAEVASIAFYIETKGLPATAKKFVDEAFHFFEKLGDIHPTHLSNTISGAWSIAL